jgi:hypothetical protein
MWTTRKFLDEDVNPDPRRQPHPIRDAVESAYRAVTSVTNPRHAAPRTGRRGLLRDLTARYVIARAPLEDEIFFISRR